MPTRFAQHLVAQGLLPAQTVDEALRRREASGGTLDTALLEARALPEASLLQALGEVTGVQPIDLAEFEPNPDMARFIPANVAGRLCAVPLSEEDQKLHVACAYPAPKRALEDIAVLLGKKLELWIAVEVRVRDWIGALYGMELPSRYSKLMLSMDPGRAHSVADNGHAHTAAATPNLGGALPVPPGASAGAVAPVSPAMSDGAVAPVWPAMSDGTGAPVWPAMSDGAGAPASLAASAGAIAPVSPAASAGAVAPVSPAASAGAVAPVSPAASAGAAVAPGSPAASAGAVAPVSPAASARAVAPGAPARSVAPVAPLAPARAATTPAPTPASAAHASSDSSSADEPIPLSSPKRGARANAVEEPTPLEDALSREVVEQIARAVAEEPILLDVRKRSAPERPAHRAEAAPSRPPPGNGKPPPLDARPPAIPSIRSRGSVPKTKPPTVVVFPGKPKPAPAPVPEPPPTTPAAVAPSTAAAEWTLAQARAALSEATHDRDQIIQVALRFARTAFDYVAAFAVVRGAVVGWSAEGEGAEAFRKSRPTIPLDSPSAFRTVAMTHASYIGPPPQDPVTGQLLSQMGRSPRVLFLFPVEVKDKLVAVLYGDHGQRAISHRRLTDLVLFCQDLPNAFQELMLYRKQAGAARAALDFDQVVAPRLPPSAVAWSPSAPDGHGVRGRAASTPGMMMEDPARAPSDFGLLLSRLTGPDAGARAGAMAELARTPEASAQALAEVFPGASEWARVAIDVLPQPEELGAIPAAIARLGRAGAQALAPLLDAPDADIRYFALLTAGSLQFPEVVGGVLRGLFDFEPDVSSAARAAAGALRRLPRLVSSLSDLRLELATKDPIRRSLAARALGVLHDRDSIDGLINLTGSDDEVCAQAAADALREITRASYGTEPRRWAAWWAVNRGRSRAQWLTAALRHAELDIRLAAIDELSRALNDTLGYVADGPVAEREDAVQRWEAAVMQIPRLRKMD
jgi:Type II secretion system (T2SS), protein E, N-terminal domain